MPSADKARRDSYGRRLGIFSVSVSDRLRTSSSERNPENEYDDRLPANRELVLIRLIDAPRDKHEGGKTRYTARVRHRSAEARAAQSRGFPHRLARRRGPVVSDEDAPADPRRLPWRGLPWR